MRVLFYIAYWFISTCLAATLQNTIHPNGIFIVSIVFILGLFCDTIYDCLFKKRKCKAIHHASPYKLTLDELTEIIDSLDETGGFLIKEGELRYWIEKKVNENLNKKSC
jgi:hypothetical protein